VKVHHLTESWRKDRLAWGNALVFAKRMITKAIENLIKRDLIEKGHAKKFLCSLQVTYKVKARPDRCTFYFITGKSFEPLKLNFLNLQLKLPTILS